MEKSVLNEVKAILKSLVLSCPDKITIDQLNKDYRDVEGEFIPYRRLGYRNLEQFLRSLPDTLMVFGSGPAALVCFVANEKSDHIHDMIMKQKKPKKTRNTHSRGKSMERNNNCIPRRHNNVVPKLSGQQLSPFQSVNRQHMTKTVQMRDLPPLVKKKSNVKALLPTFISYDLPQTRGILFNPSSNLTNQNKQYEEHVNQVSSLLKNKCHVSSQTPPPISRSHTRSVKFATETKTSNQTLNKIDSPQKHSKDNENLIIEIKIPKATKQLPLKLSQEVEDLLLDLPKLVKASNPINEASCNKICEDKSKEFEAQEIESKAEDKLKQTKDKFFNDSVDTLKDKDEDEAVPSFAAKTNVFLLDFPDYTLPYGSKIIPYKLSEDITEGSCIKIFISEIHNPFKFWFHIYKDNHELDSLMYQIERYYSCLDTEDLRIPLVCLTPGQLCAACYNGLWHRAEIVAPPVNTSIKVSFMDYGTVTEVPIENIKFLSSNFAQLPAQALRGCLSHIKPRTFHWSHEATIYFLKLVEDCMLYAKITEINKEENILYMILCNTNGDEVLQINKKLVEKRYALYNEDWKIQKINENNGKRLHHPHEDFPT
ncbi:tejas isoform 2-T2 [Cochliomyia hominivorax]